MSRVNTLQIEEVLSMKAKGTIILLPILHIYAIVKKTSIWLSCFYFLAFAKTDDLTKKAVNRCGSRIWSRGGPASKARSC